MTEPKMDKRGWMMLRVLINRYNPKAGNALLKFLPKDHAQEVMNLDIQSIDLSPILQQPQRSLGKIHYSWIQPILTELPPTLQPTAVSSLNQEQIKGMNFSPTIEISESVKSFIRDLLYQKLQINTHFPPEYLPESEFKFLTQSSKSELIDLIDFLGLYDLAAEVRKIVNREHLKNIYKCLTPKQFQFLKSCLHRKEQLVSPKMDIDPSKQDCVKLKQAIHRRGLQRLAKALCGQHPDLIWNIAHVLDKGRGNVLLKEFQPKEIPSVTKILSQQVIHLIHYLQSE